MACLKTVSGWLSRLCFGLVIGLVAGEFKCTWLAGISMSVVLEIGPSSMSLSTLLIFSCMSVEESDSCLGGELGGEPNHDDLGPLLFLASIRWLVSFILLSVSLSLLFSREDDGR